MRRIDHDAPGHDVFGHCGGKISHAGNVKRRKRFVQNPDGFAEANKQTRQRHAAALSLREFSSGVFNELSQPHLFERINQLFIFGNDIAHACGNAHVFNG